MTYVCVCVCGCFIYTRLCLYSHQNYIGLHAIWFYFNIFIVFPIILFCLAATSISLSAFHLSIFVHFYLRINLLTLLV